jgi:putative ABC transport system permease protein
VWADAAILNGFYQRPPSIFQAATVKLRSADDFPAFEALLKGDPRLNLQALREKTYYENQSQVVTTLITKIGRLVAAVMALGAVFGALNTMYSAVASRGREIATLRVIGFSRPSILTSFMLESLLLSLLGATLGIILMLPFNGMTTGTQNQVTFSEVVFSLQMTPAVVLSAVIFALIMGVVGGFAPAWHASRRDILSALRD